MTRLRWNRTDIPNVHLPEFSDYASGGGCGDCALCDALAVAEAKEQREDSRG